MKDKDDKKLSNLYETLHKEQIAKTEVKLENKPVAKTGQNNEIKK